MLGRDVGEAEGTPLGGRDGLALGAGVGNVVVGECVGWAESRQNPHVVEHFSAIMPIISGLCELHAPTMSMHPAPGASGRLGHCVGADVGGFVVQMPQLTGQYFLKTSNRQDARLAISQVLVLSLDNAASLEEHARCEASL